MAYRGAYKIKNKSKYKGNPMNVIYRSSWERNFMIYCDTNDNIVMWSSEEIKIPYRSPIDNRIHTYFPDFWIKIKKHDGTYNQILIEIKPKKQTKPPKPNPKHKRRYFNELKTWGVNEAKWIAAKKLCTSKGWTWQILTETELRTK